MAEYLHPGVYIEELAGQQPITGVSTSTTGMVGVTRKGPISGIPRLVTSFGEFRDLYGGFLPTPDPGDRVRWELDDHEGGTWWLFPLAVKGFFDNRGQRLYVKRVVSRTATASSADVMPGPIGPGTNGQPGPIGAPPPATAPLLRVAANAPGDWGDDLRVRLRPVRSRSVSTVHPDGGPIATTLTAETAPGATGATIAVNRRLDNLTGTLTVLIGGDRYTAPAPGAGATALTLTPAATKRLPIGTNVKILRPVSLAGAQTAAVPLAGASAQTLYPGALLLIGDQQATVTAVGPAAAPAGVTITSTANLPALYETDQIGVVEAELAVQYREPAQPGGDEPPVVEEVFPVRLNPLRGTPGSVVDLVRERSKLVEVEVLQATPPAVTWALFPGGDWQTLSGGNNQLGDLDPADFVGEDRSGARSGIQSLEDVEDVSICAVPGIWSTTVQSALIAHCDRLKNRFAIVDPQYGLTVTDVQAFRQRLDSSYAALYHPWLTVRDPSTGKDVVLPPSGHLAGVYARVDVDRGVHKAPANEAVLEITGFADDINEREQDVLNPIGINALRQFPLRGRRVWGARTLTSVPEWTYINVRRLFIYIESSIKQGTQWVVFEPNNEALWALVVQSVTNFLDTVWRTGALQGTKQAEAFYVHCGRNTMSQDDIDNGRLIVEIGIAATRPAEFVIFRFRQKTRDDLGTS